MTDREIAQYNSELREQERFNNLVNNRVINLELYKKLTNGHSKIDVVFLSTYENITYKISCEEKIVLTNISKNNEVIFSNYKNNTCDLNLSITEPCILRVYAPQSSFDLETFFIFQESIDKCYIYTELMFRDGKNKIIQKFISSKELSLKCEELSKNKIKFSTCNKICKPEVLFRKSMLNFGWPENYKLFEDYLWWKLNELWKLEYLDGYIGIETLLIYFGIIDNVINSDVSNRDTLILQVMNTIIYDVEETMIDLINFDFYNSLGDDER